MHIYVYMDMYIFWGVNIQKIVWFSCSNYRYISENISQKSLWK